MELILTFTLGTFLGLNWGAVGNYIALDSETEAGTHAVYAKLDQKRAESNQEAIVADAVAQAIALYHAENKVASK